MVLQEGRGLIASPTESKGLERDTTAPVYQPNQEGPGSFYPVFLTLIASHQAVRSPNRCREKGGAYSMEQQRLMERIRKGEEEAFAELVNPLIEKSYRTSFSILRSKEQAEEVIQNAMIEAYQNIMNGKEINYFTTWFYKLVSHRSIDVLRKNARLKETHIELEYLKDRQGVVESVIKQETEKEIKEGILSLANTDYRNVLLLYYYQELSIQEVSDLLGMKASTVKSHLRRARNALKTRLTKNSIIEVNS